MKIRIRKLLDFTTEKHKYSHKPLQAEAFQSIIVDISFDNLQGFRVISGYPAEKRLRVSVRFCPGDRIRILLYT